jgi:hypothetical protein
MSRNSDTLARIRSLLQLASEGNSRLTAAAIGRHLEYVRDDGYHRERVAAGVEAVRDASLRLLVALHSRADIRHCRAMAIKSTDYLEAVLLLVSAPSDTQTGWSVAA